jgi:hypothetical protein
MVQPVYMNTAMSSPAARDREAEEDHVLDRRQGDLDARGGPDPGDHDGDNDQPAGEESEVGADRTADPS